jgi:hypothetical protein
MVLPADWLIETGRIGRRHGTFNPYSIPAYEELVQTVDFKEGQYTPGYMAKDGGLPGIRIRNRRIEDSFLCSFGFTG